MIRRPVLFLLLIFPVLALPASADNLKDTLNHQYKKHVLALRSPFISGDLKFDSAGRPLSHAEGKWLLYGGVYIEKVALSSKELRVEGRRVGLGADNNKNPVLFALGKSVKLTVQLDQPLNSIDQAQDLLNRIFFPEREAADRARPELRRADDPTAGQTIYQSGKDDVKHPKATYTPEPDFSERARRARHQGTVILNIVVDEKGNVARVRLDRALGGGLDENAMERIKDWRFNPGTRNGEAVPVEMKVEVSFNLY